MMVPFLYLVLIPNLLSLKRSVKAFNRALKSHCGEQKQPLYPCFHLLGRRQAVRQRILIPSFGGSIPPAPTTATSKAV